MPPWPLHGAMLSLSGSMISISFFSDAPFINALIAVSVFPFLALPLMITIFMRVSSNFRFVAQIISHSQTYLNSNCLCPHLLHCLSACFCNQHPVNLFLHGFLCIFIEMIADNIYCLPDFLCKCVSFCFFIHHFFHNHLFPFFPVPDRERFASVPAGSLSAR